LRVRIADAAELALHEARLQRMDAASKGKCLWRVEVRESVLAEV
jgi:hypothetical protein